MYLLNVFINNPISHSLSEISQHKNTYVLQQSTRMGKKKSIRNQIHTLFRMTPQCSSASNREVASCISSWVSDVKQSIKKIIKMKSQQ